MKKSIIIPIVLILVVLLITLSSCKKKDLESIDSGNKPPESTKDIAKDDEAREVIMKDFNNILKNKDELDKIAAFLDEKIGKLSQIEGDKMIAELERVLEDSLESETIDLFEADSNGELINIAPSELFFPEEKIKDIQDEKLRNEVTKLFNSKYKLINQEGMYYPIIDYEKLKQYNSNISDELKEYISIKAMDSNEPVAIDAGLRISYDDLADRIIKTENYIQKYSEGQRYEEMLGNYRNKLNMYLNGLDNTPIAAFGTNKINKDVLDSYKKTANIKDSATAFVVNKYINVIEENNEVINKTVKDQVLSLVNEALSLLEVSK